MKKLSIALILALCLSLTGCSLLREDTSGEPAAEDKLVGVYITSEYLSTFDLESYVSDNMNSLADGGGEVSAEDAAKYSARIYGEVENGTVTFPIEGTAIITARFGEGNESYFSSQLGDYIVGGGTHVNVGEDTDSVELSGTLYAPAGEMVEAYCNPVYQQSNGEVYLVSGQGISSNGLGSMSQTLSENTDPHGDVRGYSMSIELTVVSRELSEKYVVLYYGADGELMRREEYAPGELPYELSPDGAAYAVIEDHTRDDLGELTVERTLLASGDTDGFLSFSYDPDSPWFNTYSTILK